MLLQGEKVEKFIPLGTNEVLKKISGKKRVQQISTK
jgi:hypothetical protein